MSTETKPLIVRPYQLPSLYGISQSTAWREIKAGRFPRPIRISRRCTGWRSETLDAHFEQLEQKQGVAA